MGMERSEEIQNCLALADRLWKGWQRKVKGGPRFLDWAAEDIDGGAISQSLGTEKEEQICREDGPFCSASY